MVDVTIGDLLEEAIANDSKIIFENDSGETKRDTALALANLSNGSATVLVTSESDLPPLINGFRTLEIDKNYPITETRVNNNNEPTDPVDVISIKSPVPAFTAEKSTMFILS